MRMLQPSLVALAAAAALTACGGGGSSGPSAAPGTGAQGAAYVPQSVAASASQAVEAPMPPLPEPLVALGKTGPSPDLTAPIINDSGSYTNGAIIVGTNTTTGYGMEGIAGGAGAGLYGHSSYTGGSNSYGVYGFSAAGSGVYGYAGKSGHGVLGISASGDAVEGKSTSGNGVIGETSSNVSGTFPVKAGVLGIDKSTALLFDENAGVAGESTNSSGYGVYGSGGEAGIWGSGGYYGVYGVSGLSGANAFGVYGYSKDGPGIRAASSSQNASYPALYLDTTGSSTPEILAINDDTATHVMSLDSSGNMILSGSLTVDGTVTSHAFASCTSCATPLLAQGSQIETTGGGQLVSGNAYVKLDPSFTSQLDPSQTYRVFVTPDGDTNGLYVETKSRNGFTVREIHKGTSTLAFDYRVVGKARVQQLQRPIGTALAQKPSLGPKARGMLP